MNNRKDPSDRSDPTDPTDRSKDPSDRTDRSDPTDLSPATPADQPPSAATQPPPAKTGLRLAELPKAPDDYARRWWVEHNDGRLETDLARFNAYLQTLDDIADGSLDLPGIDDQKAFVSDLKKYIRREFVTHALTEDLGNDYHKALWAFCVRRYIDQLNNGIFDGQGVRGKRPEVAAAIEEHVDTLLTDALVGD